MNWSWSVFLASLVIFTIISQFSRGAMNAANIARHGPSADYRANPGAAILGSIFAGAVYAVITTAVVGLFSTPDSTPGWFVAVGAAVFASYVALKRWLNWDNVMELPPAEIPDVGEVPYIEEDEILDPYSGRAIVKSWVQQHPKFTWYYFEFEDRNRSGEEEFLVVYNKNFETNVSSYSHTLHRPKGGEFKKLSERGPWSMTISSLIEQIEGRPLGVGVRFRKSIPQ